MKCPILPSVKTKISWLPKRLYNSYTGNQWNYSNLERKTDFGIFFYLFFFFFFFFCRRCFLTLDDQMIPFMYIGNRIIYKYSITGFKTTDTLCSDIFLNNLTFVFRKLGKK